MAKAAFQPVRKESISEEVAAQIRKEILRGTYTPGEKLPSERELALAFGVNRTTVREALQKLAGLGLVSIRQGTGALVLDYRQSGGIDLLVHLLTTPDAEGRYDARAFLSTIEMIRGIYLQAATLAFERMKDAEVDALLALIDRQLEIEDAEEFIANDHAIHRAVFQATRNIALQLLFNTFSEIYERYASPFRIFFEKDIENTARAVMDEFYRSARTCVEKRDAAALAALIEEAMTPRDPKLFEHWLRELTF